MVVFRSRSIVSYYNLHQKKKKRVHTFEIFSLFFRKFVKAIIKRKSSLSQCNDDVRIDTEISYYDYEKGDFSRDIDLGVTSHLK